LHYSLDDVSLVDAEIWHASYGRRGQYAGWQQFHGHIGLNQVRFAARGRHFLPRPGRYIAYLPPTDPYNNVGRTKTLHFTIGSPSRQHR
jgi:hypothetical protein